MNYTRQDYERLINDSPLLDTDKERDADLYKTRRNQFLTWLYKYCRIVYGECVSECGMEIMETAHESIEKYDRARGNFLNFFNYLFKKRRKIRMAELREDDVRKGIRLSKDDRSNIRKIIKFAKDRQIPVDSPDFAEKCAIALGKDKKDILELIRINTNATTMSNSLKKTDGNDEEIDIFNTGAFATDDRHDIEQKLDFDMDIDSLLDKISSIYNSLQNRADQRKLFAMWITGILIKAFGENMDIIVLVRGKEYFSAEVADYYLETGKVMEKQQIAAVVGVGPESASRNFTKFSKFFK